ncbi:MAG: protein arginine kinase [Syntrophomonas sp.]|uniref:protein arginine kinase n=1 Tax=Syntrophomonas sp. TaxID=2053627 RepID=UPI00260BABD0|nr:protein arginine kinase [Syntrophomonas sp.]MDD2509556.1 protein arginine kinase [Syntrophomonas sp.]MDD3878427.1 protein arginine kinase [Syntrophomonas sp.]MDD4625474.1 protein arginine kinase [Syntrophomonas sp.]
MNINNLFEETFVAWMNGQAASQSDIVISSRVRLARNLNDIAFPHLLNQQSGQKFMQLISEAWKKSQVNELKQMELVTFENLSALDRKILVEKHLISPYHAQATGPYQGLLVKADGSLAIMINEEDHLRIQCFLPGLQLEEAYQRAQEIDDALEEELDFAFDDHRGYLTSCPTNIGTGMRASLMLHLPAISISGQSGHIFQNLSQLGLAVRGIYGEGTEAIGNFFQLSNQITLGQSEEDINASLTAISQQVIEQERLLRDSLSEQMKYQLEDRIGRAYGILTHARLISSNEALTLLSDVRLGVDMGMIPGINPFALNELVVDIRPAHLQKKAGSDMNAVERDAKRAEVIREKLQTGK